MSSAGRRAITGVHATVPDFVITQLGALDSNKRLGVFTNLAPILEFENNARRFGVESRREGRTNNIEPNLKIATEYGKAIKLARDLYRETELLIYLMFSVNDCLLRLDHLNTVLHEVCEGSKASVGHNKKKKLSDRSAIIVERVFKGMMSDIDRASDDAEIVANAQRKTSLEEAAKAYSKAGNIIEIIFEGCRIVENKVEYDWVALGSRLTRSSRNYEIAGDLYLQINDMKGAVRSYNEAGDMYVEAAELLDYCGVSIDEVAKLFEEAIRCRSRVLTILEGLTGDPELRSHYYKGYALKLANEYTAVSRYFETTSEDIVAINHAMEYEVLATDIYKRLGEIRRLIESYKRLDRLYEIAINGLTGANREQEKLSLKRSQRDMQQELAELFLTEARKKERTVESEDIDELFLAVEYIKKAQKLLKKIGKGDGARQNAQWRIRLCKRIVDGMTEKRIQRRLAEAAELMAEAITDYYRTFSTKPERLLGIATNWRLIAAREYEKRDEREKVTLNIRAAISCARVIGSSRALEEITKDIETDQKRREAFFRILNGKKLTDQKLEV